MGTFGHVKPPCTGQICPEMMLDPLAIDWYMAYWASGPGLPAGGFDVNAWPDYTGGGRDLDVVADQQGAPSLDADAPYLNNKNAVYFSGVDGARALGRFAGVSVSQPNSIVVIGSSSSALAAESRFVDPGHVSGRQYLSYNGTGNGVLLGTGGTALAISDPPSWPVDRAAVFAAVFDGTGSFAWVNGVASAPGDVGTSGIDNFAIGGTQDTGSWLVGHVAFVGVYEGDVTTDPGWPMFVAQAQFDYGIAF